MKNNTQKTPVARMWTPPAGWFRSALKAREQAATVQYQADDNARRRERGLPTYDGGPSIQG